MSPFHLKIESSGPKMTQNFGFTTQMGKMFPSPGGETGKISLSCSFQLFNYSYVQLSFSYEQSRAFNVHTEFKNYEKIEE